MLPEAPPRKSDGIPSEPPLRLAPTPPAQAFMAGGTSCPRLLGAVQSSGLEAKAAAWAEPCAPMAGCSAGLRGTAVVGDSLRCE